MRQTDTILAVFGKFLRQHRIMVPHRPPPLRASGILLKWSLEMHHLPDPDKPLYVSDRLSAVSNIPIQFLVSVAMVAVILVAASLTDFMPTSDGSAGFVDAQKTASVSSTGPRFLIGDRDGHVTDSMRSEYVPSHWWPMSSLQTRNHNP
jgi:hypothetical protein